METEAWGQIVEQIVFPPTSLVLYQCKIYRTIRGWDGEISLRWDTIHSLGRGFVEWVKDCEFWLAPRWNSQPHTSTHGITLKYNMNDDFSCIISHLKKTDTAIQNISSLFLFRKIYHKKYMYTCNLKWLKHFMYV